ncbi:hypothetical protein BGX21_007526, partial [Mortierella sp. AD011]
MGQSSTTDALNSLPDSAGNEYGGGALADNPEDGDGPNDEIEDEVDDDDEYDPEDRDGDDDPEDLPRPSSGSKQVLKEQKTKFINSISDSSKVIEEAEFDRYG